MTDDDELTLTPVYKFEWEDGTTRTTNEEDAIEDDADWTPEAAEFLAVLGREDPECTVTLVGMGS